MTPLQALFASASLCAATLCLFLFPEMKTLLVLVPFALAILSGLSGCAGGPVRRMLRALPEGGFESMRAVETGKFTSTTIEGKGLDKHEGVVRADSLHAQHTNPWLTNLEFTATKVELDVGHDAATRPTRRTPKPAPTPPAIPVRLPEVPPPASP